MPETIEERLANSPVRGVIEVIDAITELRRRADEIQRLEREARARECPSCGWRSNG
jgi:succinate dehydrogenase/fumarate reductase-like Fe-S protein